MLQWLELLGVKEATPGVRCISTEEKGFALASLFHGITQQVFLKLFVGATTYPHDKREAYQLLLVADGCTAAITNDDRLYTWGDGASGNLGYANTLRQFIPRQVEKGLGDLKITQV